MQTVNDSTTVAPALEKYVQGPLTELPKRPGLTPGTATSLPTSTSLGNEKLFIREVDAWLARFRWFW
jgi:hypothetical protein